MDVVHLDEKANAGMDVNKAVEEFSGYLEVTLKEKQCEAIVGFLKLRDV